MLTVQHLVKSNTPVHFSSPFLHSSLYIASDLHYRIYVFVFAERDWSTLSTTPTTTVQQPLTTSRYVVGKTPSPEYRLLAPFVAADECQSLMPIKLPIDEA